MENNYIQLLLSKTDCMVFSFGDKAKKLMEKGDYSGLGVEPDFHFPVDLKKWEADESIAIQIHLKNDNIETVAFGTTKNQR